VPFVGDYAVGWLCLSVEFFALVVHWLLIVKNQRRAAEFGFTDAHL
jgi:hypothetical protein